MPCLTMFREAHLIPPVPGWRLYLHVYADLRAPYLWKDTTKDGGNEEA